MMTEKTANAMFAKWKKVLNLQDWDIKFCWKKRASEMPIEGASGCCEYVTSLKQAVISMLDEDDYANDDFPYDYEKTLVHEMMHIKFALVDLEPGDTPNPVHSKAVHQMVDDFAGICVGLNRAHA